MIKHTLLKISFLFAIMMFPLTSFASNNYSTTFPSIESSISENGHWTGGLTTGLDWTNIATNSNGARSTQTGTANPSPNDSLAVLTGTWGANQQVEEIIRTTNQPSGNVFEEFEILLRFTITAHSVTGYEVNFSTNKNYVQIVRWNGAFNVYQYLNSVSLPTLVTGDVLKATITGTNPAVITVRLNGTVVLTANDNGTFGGAVYTTGNPGMGLYYQQDGSGGTTSDFSITSYVATDATIRDATDCTATAVQAQMTLATAAYDVVVIPACPSGQIWTSAVSWSAPDSAILKCAGTSATGGGDKTVILDQYADPHAMLLINSITGTFRFTGCTFKKGSGVGTQHDQPGTISLLGSSTSFRFDHNRLNLAAGNADNGSGIKITGPMGVVDHNIVDLNSTGTGNGMKMAGLNDGNEAWATATAFGSSDFLFFEDNIFTAIGFGGNGHSNGATNDCDHGGKQVWRFNIFGTNATTGGGASLQTHPLGGSGVDARGCRATEIYSNQWLGNSTHSSFGGIFLSSGGGLIWNNPMAVGYEHMITIHSMRKSNATYPESDQATGWAYCGPSRQTGTVTTDGGTNVVTWVSGGTFNTSWPAGASEDFNTTMIVIGGNSYKISSIGSSTQLTLRTSPGTNASPIAYTMGSDWDENINTLTGKRCLDQPGNGVGDLLTGASPNKKNSRTNSISWSNQALEPVREFMNTPFACSGCDRQDFISVYEPSVLVENENYYLHAGWTANANVGTGEQTACPTPSTCTPFNGTVGNGWGTLALRPPLCTVGTGYFIKNAVVDLGIPAWNSGTNGLYTGNGALQVCTSTNTWTTSYTPYTYPHPLTNGITSVLPSITSVSVLTGVRGLNKQDVTVTGLSTTFSNGTTTCNFGAGISINSCVVASSSSVVANITILGSATLGARDVVITTGAEVATATSGFTVLASPTVGFRMLRN